MRALTISEHGSLDRLTVRDDVPMPALTSPTDVRVRVRAAALNHLDLHVVRGLPGIRITAPWILGGDATGVIDAVGDAAAGPPVGTSVIINPGLSCRACDYCRADETPLCVKYGILGEHFPGTFAEYVVVPAANVRAIPTTTAAEVAAAFPLATLTAWRMLVTRARVQPGETVLIQGIGGGVAIQSLLIAKQLGARVWVTSRDPEKLARARALGADETLDTASDVAKEIRWRTGKRGVDVVIDNVGAATWAASLGSLGRGGRLVTCGGTSGPIVETDVRRLFWNQWNIMGSTMGNDAEFDAITAELSAGRLTPPVDRVFPLEEGRAAFERLAEAKQFGKIVLTVGAT